MPELPAPEVLIYLAVAASGTAILHSVGGFAGALLLSVALSPVLGIKLTIPLVSVAMVVSHGIRAFVFRKSVDWQIFFLLITAALPFILIGVYTYVGLSEAAVGWFLGSLLLITIPLRRVLKNKKITIHRSVISLVAIPYGLLSGASFGVGLMLGPFLLGAGLTGEALVATVAVQGVTLNLIKTIAFGISPLLGFKEMVLGLWLGLCTFPGHYIGHKIVNRATDSAHVLFIEALMLAGALYFISRGFLV